MACSFGPTAPSETATAEKLLPLLNPTMLLLNDRGFDTDDFLAKAAATGAQLLVRIKGARTPARRASLPDGSYLTMTACGPRSMPVVRRQVRFSSPAR